MLLGELIEGLGIQLADAGDASVRICDISEDSRTILPGTLFIARPGTKADGRAFINQAIASDAAAILTDPGTPRPKVLAGVAWLTTEDLPLAEAQLAERFYGNPSSQLRMIGITGTNGKTTTAHLIHQLLNETGERCGLIGTVMIDDGGKPAKALMTTPPALELSYSLARMIEHGCKACSMEVSSHSLDQKRVAALKFDVGIFTNLTGDHLDYHGTMERYAAAKALLFRSLGADGVAIVNADDPAHELMIKGCAAKVLRCTVDAKRGSGAECAAVVRNMSVRGTEVEFSGPWGVIEGTIQLIGAFNIMNCLQAIAAAHVSGVSRDEIALNLFTLAAPPGRLERVQHEAQPADSFAVFVDYAHTDDALVKAITSLRPLIVGSGGKLHVVFGCGGDRDKTKRPRMARAVIEHADEVIVTSDNPRTENPSSIIRDILTGIESEAEMARVVVDADRRAAIRRAIERAQPGDIVLIAGKGHEDYQLVSDGRGGILRLDFDDRTEAMAALGERFAGPAGREGEITIRPGREASPR